MSRIYEALQRAESERRNLSFPDSAQTVGDVVATPVCEPLPVEAAIDFESLSRQSWTPDLAALPTLADSGKCVEQFRSLRSHLQLQRLQQDLKCILISSGLPAEGKTFVAVNLAMSLAHNSDRNVLLIDADLRRPASHRLLGAPVSPGLADYLEGRARIEEIIQRSVVPKCSDIDRHNCSNLAFVPAGKCSGAALELICSHRIDEFISQISPVFDWVIIDSPPVLVVTDAIDLAHAVDGVVLVARAGNTSYKVAQKTRQVFSNSRLLGFVLNAVTDISKDDPYYSYYHRDASDSPAASKKKDTRRSRK